MAFDLTGRVALVTGGGRGIGAAIAARFAEHGARVVIVNRTLEAAERIADTLCRRDLSARALPWPGTERATLKSLVDQAVREEERLDILVHNAGGCPWGNVEDLDDGQLTAALDINFSAFVWLVQAAIPHMRRQGFGRLLVTSSVSARVAMGGGAHYSAAKAAVNAFMRGAAFELARDGITVNAVEPGFIAKPGRGTLSTPEKQAAISRHIPIGRMGEADDIASAMLYLASPEAKYVTGQTLAVDGGSTLPETGYAVESFWGLA
ncbi:SDR family oxidoreductase [Mesorhizobium sp. RMAD-H1]|uniref:SDR family oxidoreductase n=1 Tax=Mesorhizobium sp. RMAD-H1 TaxID=2587065 RepID=UPI00160F7D2D|nr:SDR family oxidoreductase [Mesorhizobium sp. RMAD-H1]MBB2971561.1 3-oxoacyl-[acyl-carrier protein] reductase [Mesorhizobium sp. RMAD-H1]